MAYTGKKPTDFVDVTQTKDFTVAEDLTVGGGVYLGGTGSANKLDDYEEGTFTGTVTFDGSSPTAGASTATGKYRKIGSQVTVQFEISNINVTGASGNNKITGLPFTASSGLYMGAPRVRSVSVTDYIQSFVTGGTTYLRLEENTGSAFNTILQASAFTHAASDITITITYFTA